MSRDHDLRFRQTDKSVAKNKSFFGKHRDEYDKNVQELDTYKAIRSSINEAIRGIDRLLDIGNGGVFDYETSIAGSIVALDLFFDDLPTSFTCPQNVTLRTGSALAIPEPDESFDGVLIAMLIHHLVGRTVKESIDNIHRVVREAFRVLRPGGRLIIVESCVPQWFFLFESLLFPLAAPLINILLRHPATLQYPTSLIARIVEQSSSSVENLRIPKGRYILQFGHKLPSVFTPASPYRFVAHKFKPSQATEGR